MKKSSFAILAIFVIGMMSFKPVKSILSIDIDPLPINSFALFCQHALNGDGYTSQIHQIYKKKVKLFFPSSGKGLIFFFIMMNHTKSVKHLF